MLHAPGLTPAAVLEKLAKIQMIEVWIPTVDQRWLILPRYTQPSPDTKLLIEKLRLELPSQPPLRLIAQKESNEIEVQIVRGARCALPALRGGGALWPEHAAMRAPHSRAPQSARKQDRECCGHNHEIEARAVKAEIDDGNKEQRKHENPRYFCDRCYQLKSPVEARFRVSPFTLRLR